MESVTGVPTGDAPLSLDGFAVEFLRHAAGPERLARMVHELLGECIEIGPVPVGPGGIATAKARGKVRFVRGRTLSADGRRQVVHTGVDLHVTVRVAGRTVRFEVSLVTEVRVTLRLLTPLAITADVDPIAEHDIAVEFEVSAMVGRALQRLGSIDSEVRRLTKTYIEDLLASPRAAAVLRIDVAALVEHAWSSGIIDGGIRQAG